MEDLVASEITTIGIRAVDPRMRGDGFDAGEFLLRSKINEFLMKQKKAQKGAYDENVEVAASMIKMEDLGADFSVGAARTQKLSVHIATGKDEYQVFDEISDPNMEKRSTNEKLMAEDIFDSVVNITPRNKIFDEMRVLDVGIVDATKIEETKDVNNGVLLEKMTLVHELGELQSTHQELLTLNCEGFLYSKLLATDLNLEGFNVILMFDPGIEGKARVDYSLVNIQIQRQIEKVVGLDFYSTAVPTWQHCNIEATEGAEQQMFDEMAVKNLAKKKGYSRNLSDFILLLPLGFHFTFRTKGGSL